MPCSLTPVAAAPNSQFSLRVRAGWGCVRFWKVEGEGGGALKLEHLVYLFGSPYDEDNLRGYMGFGLLGNMGRALTPLACPASRFAKRT